MPISCAGGGKPRYRFTRKGGKKVRLAFCGAKEVVEAVVFKGKKKVKTKKLGGSK